MEQVAGQLAGTDISSVEGKFKLLAESSAVDDEVRGPPLTLRC
jgi:hypothetical protein